MAEPVRSLDQTTTSMDVVALNNVIVNMRNVVKRAKLFVITKITKQIKMYRSKKGTDQQVEANKRRAERLVQEIDLIKKANVDRVGKFSLANTKKCEQLLANDPLETRAMTRISCHPLMQERIKKFRSEHEDWPSLAAYLLSKNTGRRFKTKKKKEKTVKKITRNESENESDNSDDDEPTDKGIHGESDADQTSDKESEVASDNTKPAESRSVNELENSSENESESIQENKSENTPNSDSESKNEEEESSVEDSDVSMEEFSNKKISKDSRKTTENKEATKVKTVQSKSSKISNETSKIKSQTEKAKLTITHSKQNKEMVVKKLNLNNLDAELEALSKPGKETEDISFLFKSSDKDNESGAVDNSSDNEKTENKEETKVKKRKDAFFIMGDEDSDDNDDDMEVDNDDMDANAEIEEDGYDNMHARSLVDSTFIESLGQKKARKKQAASYDSSLRGRGSFRGQNFRGSNRGGRPFDNNNRERWQGKLHQKPYSQQRPPMSGRTFGNQARGDYKRNDTSSQKPGPKYYSNTGGATAASSTEKLHPSWEASKKKKEQAMHIPSFKGKKTTFDD